MPVDAEMPKYQCHKKVWALKIAALSMPADTDEWDGRAVLTPEDERYAPFELPADYCRKHKPEVGGYYVVYEDGYSSYSPAAAFEAGYTPISAESAHLSAALNLRFDSDAGQYLTLRDYLRTLLTTVWEEGEGFSGKRPFGNSGWEYDLYRPLIKAGFVGGKLDEKGSIEELNEQQGNLFIKQLIIAAFGGV